MSESIIEKYLVSEVKKLGGTAYKFVSPGHAGVPDRLCLMPNGTVFFVELKATGKTTRPLQDRQIEKIQAYGQRVYIADSKEKIKEILEIEGGRQSEVQAT
nr:MAG TPA: Nuclease [Caudoviricetes sp.]